jgi:hypothetical protein
MCIRTLIEIGAGYNEGAEGKIEDVRTNAKPKRSSTALNMAKVPNK